jgi:hypothetical protein
LLWLAVDCFKSTSRLWRVAFVLGCERDGEQELEDARFHGSIALPRSANGMTIALWSVREKKKLRLTGIGDGLREIVSA